MSQVMISMKKVVSIIAVTWIISLVTTLAIVYEAPYILPDNSISSNKLVDGSLTSGKIMDATITSIDLADGGIMTVKLADGSVTTFKIANDAITTQNIADGSITTDKLASNAIPYAIAYGANIDATDTHIGWVDMDSLSCSITLQKASLLLIMLSVDAKCDAGQQIVVRAMVGGDAAAPGEIPLTAYTEYAGSHSHSESEEGSWLSGYHTHTIYSSGLHMHALGYMGYSFNFIKYVPSGTSNIKIQWHVTGGTGHVAARDLVVIGLP